MYIVPVTSTIADKPLEEVADLLSYAGYAEDSTYVVGTGNNAPVYDDDITVRHGKKSISDVSVNSRISISVPTVRDYFYGCVRVVIRVYYAIDVAVLNYLWATRITPTKDVKHICYRTDAY